MRLRHLREPTRRTQQLPVVASWELAEELVGVLGRPKLDRYAIYHEDVEELLLLLGALLPSVDVVEILDSDDDPVVAAALSGGADAIATGDSDLLGDAKLRAWLGN